MLSPDDRRLVTTFMENSKALSAERAAELAGISEATARRLKGGVIPSRLTTDVRMGLLRFANLPPEQGEAVSVPAHADYVALPRYEVQVAAGVGLPVLSEEVVDWIHFKTDWLRRTMGLDPRQLALIEAVGDSMAPTIEDGDLLMVDVSPPVLRGEGVYVLALSEDLNALMVKRIAMKPRGGLTITSDNGRYGGKYDIEPSEVETLRVVGRVVWVAGRL